MAQTLTKTDLVRELAKSAGVSQADTDRVLTALGHQIMAATRDGLTVLTPFGRFAPKVRAARTGRNPRTGEPVEIAERRTVSFKPAKPKS